MPKRYSKEEYINIFNTLYPTLELLSEYNGNKNYIMVRCIIHDYIFQTKPNWLKSGSGCQKCYNDRRGLLRRKEINVFIRESQVLHNDKYDYSKVEYVNNNTKVCIICPIHGEFWQKPNKHLNGQGCPYCAIEKNADNRRMPIDVFIEKANNIHKGFYDYSNVEYQNCETAVKIICPIHGEFEQTPYIHLIGCGCPLCNMSHLERNVKNILEESNIKYIHQYRFDINSRQSLDFYLPDYNIAIECQGKQHFQCVDFFGGKKGFENRLKLDERKFFLLKEKNIKVLYLIPNDIEKTLAKSINQNIYLDNIFYEKETQNILSIIKNVV